MSDEKKESRIKVNNLPRPTQELTAEEAKQVQGGIANVSIEAGSPSSQIANIGDQTVKGSQQAEDAHPHSGVANLFSKI